MKKIALFVLCFFLTLNFVTTGGHFDSHDGILYFLVTENIVLNHSMKLDPHSPSVKTLEFEQIIENFVRFWVPEKYEEYLNGEKTPFFIPGGILGPLLAVPAYTLSTITNSEPTNIVPFFTNSIIIALTSLVIFLTSERIFKSQKIGFILALIFNFTTFVWPYNTSFFMQPVQGLIFVTTLFFLIKSSQNGKLSHIIISGIFLGITVLVHPSSVIVIPSFIVFGIIKMRNLKKIICYIVPMIAISSIQLLGNFVKYETITNFGYDSIDIVSSHSDWEGLLGMIFSPGWGLIFYFPLILLLPFAFLKMYKKDKTLLFLVFSSFLSIWIFFGTEPTPHWSGFGSWGPRYFIPFIPIAVIALGYLLQPLNRYHKISIAILAGTGFIVNLLGKLVWYMTGYGYGWGMEKLLEKEDSFNYFAWVPYYSPIMEHLKVLITNYGFETANPITKKLGCAVDIFVYCTGGILPLVIGILVAFVIGYIIFKKIFVPITVNS